MHETNLLMIGTPDVVPGPTRPAVIEALPDEDVFDDDSDDHDIGAQAGGEAGAPWAQPGQQGRAEQAPADAAPCLFMR